MTGMLRIGSTTTVDVFRSNTLTTQPSSSRPLMRIPHVPQLAWWQEWRMMSVPS